MLTHRELGLASDLEVVDLLLSVDGQFIIDAGCGDLSLSKALAQRGARVLGIDPDAHQARLNTAADVIPNVGFAETTADRLPVEPGSVDGVIFSYSLHHVPVASYAAVFEEVRRVLKPAGFLLVVEPVASGNLYQVMQLFHDETQVRADAQAALREYAIPYFRNGQTLGYHSMKQFQSFQQYAEQYSALSYNENYTEADIRRREVEELFEQVGAPTRYLFEKPMHVTYLQGQVSSASA